MLQVRQGEVGPIYWWILSLPFTSVVSLHMNPTQCGVARFGKQLADRLGVPFVSTLMQQAWGDFPLLSLKWSEFNDGPAVHPEYLPKPYGVFWHDAGVHVITNNAAHVFYADPSLGSPGLWCPSLIVPRKQPVKLFSFGMAHKLQTEKFRRVRELLDAAGLPFHLRVSVGLHEGTSLDGAEQHFDALREILGPENVTILGILSDDAVSEELAKADYVLAFFEHGVRANNTTVHAALDHGCRVITNTDFQSPSNFVHATHSIDHLLSWPNTGVNPWSWDYLIAAMEKVCASSPSTVAR